jgi:phosphosulfolactate phosphohydrolase-like enzyme
MTQRTVSRNMLKVTWNAEQSWLTMCPVLCVSTSASATRITVSAIVFGSRRGEKTRLGENVTVICCKRRIAFGIEAAALSGEIAELALRPRRVVIDLSGVEMIDADGLAEHSYRLP